MAYLHRILLSFFGIASLCGVTQGCLRAEVAETCPASVNIPVAADPKGLPSGLYGFTIEAKTPRNFTGDVIFYTDSGWYRVTVPHVAMTYTVRHFVEEDGTLWPSPTASSGVNFVQFPEAVTILDAWVISGITDAPQWVDKGTATCEPTGSIGATRYRDPKVYYSHLPANELAAFLPPQNPNASTNIQPLLVKSISPLEHPDCVIPFADARATNTAEPFTPEGVPHGTLATVLIQITVGLDGQKVAASVYQSSKNPTLDHATLRAALDSQYSPRILYCRKVSGTYLFRADFYNP